MENPLRRAAVGGGIVKDPLKQAVRAERGVFVLVGIGRQRQLAGEAMAIEDQGRVRKFRARAGAGEVDVNEFLQALVDGAERGGGGDIRFRQRQGEVTGEAERLEAIFIEPGLADGGEGEVEVADAIIARGGGGGKAEAAGRVHGDSFTGFGRPHYNPPMAASRGQSRNLSVT